MRPHINRDFILAPVMQQTRGTLIHLADQLVNVGLAVARVPTLDKVERLALVEATVGAGQLEGPEEVAGLLEVRADSVDLVDQVLHADDPVLAEGLLDDLVVGQGDALAVNLPVATLVDELADRLEVGLAVGNVGLDKLEHLRGGLGELHKDTVVDLAQTEELQDLAGLRGQLVDTLDADNKGKLGLTGDVEAAGLASDTLHANLVLLSSAVLLDVGLCTLEDGSALGLAGLARLDLGGRRSRTGLLNGLALLEDVLGDRVQPTQLAPAQGDDQLERPTKGHLAQGNAHSPLCI